MRTAPRVAVGGLTAAAACAAAALLASCGDAPTSTAVTVQTSIHLSTAGLVTASGAALVPTTVLDTVAVTVSPGGGVPDTLKATFDEQGEVNLDVSVMPGTVLFGAFVLSNNGTQVFSADQRVLDVQADGFLVELELQAVAPALAVDPAALTIDALNPGRFTVINIGTGDLVFTTDASEADFCAAQPCLVVTPDTGRVAAGDSLGVTVRSDGPDAGVGTIRVVTASGSLPVAVSVTASPLPRAPDLAGVVTPGAIELTWSDPNDQEDLIRLERGTDGIHWSEIAILPAGTVAYTDRGIESATTYHYRVRSCAVAVCSPFSTPVVLRTPDSGSLSTPTLFALPVSDTRIDLTWADNSTSESEFRLERSIDQGTTWTQIVALAPNSNGFSDRGLAPGGYRYRVRACNATNCSPYSNEVAVTLPLEAGSPPQAPSDLMTDLGFSEDFIEVSWTDNSSDETEFLLERSTDGTTWEVVATVGENTVAFIDRRVKGPETYFYRVRACNARGCSAYSNIDSTFVP